MNFAMLFLSLAAPLSVPEQIQAVEQIAETLVDDDQNSAVDELFHRDAVFVGDKPYSWSLASFRTLLEQRNCAPRKVVWSAEQIARSRPTEQWDQSVPESLSGPGIVLYCVGAERVAAYEIYTFIFRNEKIAKVYLASVMAPPPAPPMRSRVQEGRSSD